MSVCPLWHRPIPGEIEGVVQAVEEVQPSSSFALTNLFYMSASFLALVSSLSWQIILLLLCVFSITRKAEREALFSNRTNATAPTFTKPGKALAYDHRLPAIKPPGLSKSSRPLWSTVSIALWSTVSIAMVGCFPYMVNLFYIHLVSTTCYCYCCRRFECVLAVPDPDGKIYGAGKPHTVRRHATPRHTTLRCTTCRYAFIPCLA